MPDPVDFVRTAVLTLLVGVAIPVLVQAFLTLRAFQRSLRSIEAKLDDAVALMAGPGRSSGSDSLALVASAMAPAIIAGVRAYRATKAPATGNGMHATSRNGQDDLSDG